jgi:hypothetical protein
MEAFLILFLMILVSLSAGWAVDTWRYRRTLRRAKKEFKGFPILV